MPGSEAGLHFAQRLGIGRYAPCILVFTEIGELKVHILPFHGRTADEIYRHVRQWIDFYYEINHDTLEYWATVEKEIERLLSRAATSLSSVRNWSDQRRRDWRMIRRLAELIQALTEGRATAVAQLAALATDRETPWQLSSTLQEFRKQFDDFNEQYSAGEKLSNVSR